MNVTVDDLLKEIGSLHMQAQMLQQQISRLQEQVAVQRLQAATPQEVASHDDRQEGSS